ncbi:DUF2339 domain-containing protein [Chitinophaga vietnamensis]|uniref:DUF2339 domain-containing protein n=1 Tax=Chitinophaga vietnamensis TaxID=2593957 RepID=UPI0011776BF9|nr:DUF2339 domain-containing protein [Chitinophaga vietnamensis]
MVSAFIFILLIVILILILQLKGDLNSKITILQTQLEQLLQQRREDKPTAVSEPTPASPPPTRKPDIARPLPSAVPPPVQEPLPPVREAPPVKARPLPPETPRPQIPKVELTTSPEIPPIVPPPLRSRSSFREKNPDLEKFIGENLFNKIGIAILVLGIGFFLKYAIDKNWINETGRTFIGILTGAAMIGLAHRMRKTFAAFSSVLIGGGVAVLYFTITIAFQQYHLIGQVPAFILLVIVTAFTVLLSLAYDRRELAVIAILGGFTAPFLVSTGEGNATVLFTYILVLNVGMLVLAYYKKWNIVNLVCYVATVLLVGSWLSYQLVKESPAHPVPYGTALVFCTLFYIVFFVMNVVYNVKQQRKFAATDILLLMSNTFFYYAAGMVILHHIQGGIYQGLFTASMAVFNLVFAWSLFKNERADRTLIYLLIGLVLTFLSLAAPIQLHGNYITLFWAAESVVLLWLAHKSGIKLMIWASMIVLMAMFLSLIMNWSQLYISPIATAPPHMTPLLNKGFVTGVVAATAVYLSAWLLREMPANTLAPVIEVAVYRKLLNAAALLLTYIVLLLELHHQSRFYWPQLTNIIMGAYSYLFLSVLLYLARNNSEPVKVFLLLLSAASLVAMPMFNREVIPIRNAFLNRELPAGYFYFHYLLMAAEGLLLYRLYRFLNTFASGQLRQASQWVFSVVIIYLLSAALDHIWVVSGYSGINSINTLLDSSHRTGYAILWGIFAFVLMYLGLKWRSRHIRIIAISVFGVTLLKLFVFDLSNLSEGGKIAAFISLGVLLLVISFMYQRLKKLLLDDDHKTTE